MAKFDRKTLRKLFEDAEVEVPKDVLGQLCDLHTSSTDEITEALKEAQSNLDKVTQERDDLKKNAPQGETVSKDEFDKMKKDFDEYKNGIEADRLKVAKDKAYRSILKEANISAKRYDAICKLANLKDEELDENGNFKNHDKILKNVQTEFDDWVETTTTKGAKIDKPPANNSNGGVKTKDEIMAIKDANERQQAIAENLDLFD